jgi:Domain of unknown function (DUF1818)
MRRGGGFTAPSSHCFGVLFFCKSFSGFLDNSDMARQLKSGEGWRLGWNPDAPEFCGLVGGRDWAIELTQAEFDDFCRLLHQLAETMQQMAQELMAAERICCEVESNLIWLEAEGFPQIYELRLMLLSGRKAEGKWDAAAVPALVSASQTLQVF